MNQTLLFPQKFFHGRFGFILIDRDDWARIDGLAHGYNHHRSTIWGGMPIPEFRLAVASITRSTNGKLASILLRDLRKTIYYSVT